MTVPEDNWPLPKFNPGSHFHLHALGVIAVTVAQFERSVDSHYFFHPRLQKIPDELINLYYFNLNEEKRLVAIREVFAAFEKSDAVKAKIGNLLEYFQWCRNVRNQILHAEQYPPSFGGDPEVLHLTKRIAKQNPNSGYMAFKLSNLRMIAERMRAGIVQSATIHIHLRVRGQSLSKIEPSLRAYAREPLPDDLIVPRPLQLNPKP